MHSKTNTRTCSNWGGEAQWVTNLTRNRWVSVSREFEPNSKSPVVSLSKKLHFHCLYIVLVGFSVNYISKKCLFHNRT